jgi:cellulose synthase operon protein C
MHADAAFRVSRGRHIATAALLAAVSACSLAAQRAPQPPRAASARPAQPSDTIARLAVDPTRITGNPVLFLLDEFRAHVERDGTGTRTHRTVMQVISQAGVNGAAEKRFSWQPGRQELTLDWVRVLQLDGTVISDAPSADQTGDATASMQNPIYMDSRTRRISLSGVAPGTLVDVQYTVTDRTPWRAGDFLIGWQFTPTAPVRTSALSVSVPRGYAPHIVERNLSFRRAERDSADRHVYEWRAMAPPIVRPEPFAADSDGVHMRVLVAAPHSWDSVTTWYDGLARDRYALDAATAARADSMVRGARTRRDTLERLHKWIAQDVRYVSVSLGLGGYQPRTPAEVLRTGYGDCKDKTTLFVAVARRWKIEAHPVLLHLNGVRELEPVSIGRFNHAIAAVAEPGGGYTFTDLTASTIPYGELPASYRGSLGVVVRPDGRAQTVQFPTLSAERTGTRVRLDGSLRADGRMDLLVDETPIGDAAWAMRAAFATPLDSARRATGLRGIANGYLPESTPDSLITFDGLDFAQDARLRAWLRDGRGARPAGPVWLLHLPPVFRQIAGSASATARELDAQPRRQLPIDAARVVGGRSTDVEYRITLPAGWNVQLPPPVVATSFFARYESSYRLDGRTLIMRRQLISRGDGVHAPERIAEVVAWMRAVAADDLEFITLTPAP